MATPSDRLYTKTHEWIKLDWAAATVGLTEFAVHAIKDIVFLELPPAGKALEGGKAFGVVESVKAVFDLNAPLSGTVSEANGRVADDFNLLAADPYGAGWLVRLSGVQGDQGALMDAAAYAAFCEHEQH